MRGIVCSELIINVINKNIDKPVFTLGIPDMFDANQALKSWASLYVFDDR